MNELAQIIDAYEQLSRDGSASALATVVAVEGSSYRKPGARMLIAMDGRYWGGVSGGCLERDVARRARNVIDSRVAVVCRYETDGDDPLDPVWTPSDPGASLGCGGSIEILIEPIPSRESVVMNRLIDVVRNRLAATLVTLARTGGEIDARPGDRLDNVRDPHLAAAMRDDVASANGVETRRHVFAHGWADVLIEQLAPPLLVTIYGDGGDVEPLVSISKMLGWHVSVIRSRDAIVASESDSAVIVMTHNLRRDAAILRELLGSNGPRYVGVLGPRHRTERLLIAISDTVDVAAASERLFYPVGLDIGAETPEQVALAIASELQAFLNGRTGGRLRDSDSSIHGPMRAPISTEIRT